METTNKVLRRIYVSVALLLVGAAIILGIRHFMPQQEADKTYTELKGEIFHTYFRIKYDLNQDYSSAVDSTFKAFSHSLNPFDSTSLISDINRNKSMQTDSMLRYVWLAAREISEKSGGTYDVTCSPFINAWGFGFDTLNKVTPETLDSLHTFVGYQKVRLQGDQFIKQDARTIFDFSSISKGYCSDLVGQTLHTKGSQNYLVELGGEIAFKGLNPEGQPWRVGINKPIEDTSGVISELEAIVTLDMPKGGLATSGNYRNFKLVNGKKVAHTINPLTGYPVQTDVLSATILAPSCMLADGLATACMTMTSKDVPAFIAKFPGVEYLLILPADGERGFKMQMSDGMRRLISEP